MSRTHRTKIPPNPRFEIAGRAWSAIAFEGDDLLVCAEGATWRHRGKKTSKVAARLDLARGAASLRRTKAGKWEYFRDGAKVSGMSFAGQPIPSADEQLTMASSARRRQR